MGLTMGLVNDVHVTRMQYEKTGNAKIDGFYAGLTNAAEKSQSKAVGDAMALTMIPFSDSLSYGLAAFHSDKSTSEDPIIKISCNYGGEQRYYDVHVNEVNASNASAVEMFALCAYLDEQGITDKGTFGSFNKLNVYGRNAAEYGNFIDLQNGYSYNTKVDWIKMLKEMAETYLLNSKTYEQSIDANRLSDVLSKYTR